MSQGSFVQFGEACEPPVSHGVRQENPMKSTLVRYVRHSGLTRPCVRMHGCVRTPACMCTRLHASHTSHTPHANADRHLRAHPCPTPPLTRLTEKDEMAGEVISKVIRCTEANAAEFAALVNGWPELKALVRSLRADDLFPGLRGLQVTLTGAPDWVAKGLAAVGDQNAATAAGETDAH